LSSGVSFSCRYTSGTIAKKDDDLRQCKTASHGFGAQEFAAFAAVSHGADITCGVWIAQGGAVFIGGGLGEDATEFGFTGFGGAVLVVCPGVQ